MSLHARLTPLDEVGPADREAMLRLMRRHYDNVSPEAFQGDLAEKRWAILVRATEAGELCGFSTQTVLEGVAGGTAFRALFSGDTIIDRAYWGDPVLARTWGRLALELIDGLVDRPLYWFLLSQGYKTYRFLPLYFHEFWPRHDAATPPEARDVVAALARTRYDEWFDASAGVVRAGPSQYRLREGVAELSAARLRDPHVGFFAAANPGHARGDELCCLAPLTRENFTRAAYRVIGREPAAAEAS